MEADSLFWKGDFEASLARLQSLDSARLSRRSRRLWARLGTLSSLLLERPSDARTWFNRVLGERIFPSSANDRALSLLLEYSEGRVASDSAQREKLHELRTPLGALLQLVAAILAERANQPATAKSHLENAIARGGEVFVVARAVERYESLFPGEPVPGSPKRVSLMSELGDLAQNFWCGQRLLLFRKVAREQFAFSYEQLVLLVLLNLTFATLPRFLDYTPGAKFFVFGSYDGLAWVFSLLLTSLLVGYVLRRAHGALEMSIALLSATPVLHVLSHARLELPGESVSRLAELALSGWLLLVVAVRTYSSVHSRRVLRAGAAALMYGALLVWPFGVSPELQLWYTPHRPAHDVPSERLLFGQAERLQQIERNLLPDAPGTIDPYLIAFAAWGAQDVFLNEARFVQKLFDARFATRGRSILLANYDASPTSTPLASLTNLERALHLIGNKMNREEDVLILFMTSHGRRTELGVELSRVPLEEITPNALRHALDDAKIKWRVVIVSACESGGFVDALKSDQTLIVTAAAADKKSFGCASGRQLTDFGQALFAEALTHDTHFVRAFERAREIVRQREASRGLEASDPQIFIGSNVAGKLHALETRISKQNDVSRDN
ncbi:MAG TPA: C13 family peptidase [Polyangiaceae bacterium]